MPQPTLQKLVAQAERARAALYLRGFAEGSLRSTVSRVQALIGQRRVAIQIDPLAIDRYGVERVPSFVLLRSGARPVACASGTCAPPDSFVKVSGDVSVDYALEAMQRRAPGMSREAESFLHRLRTR